MQIVMETSGLRKKYVSLQGIHAEPSGAGGSGAAYPQMARTEAIYDPENFFRVNAKIVPDSGALGP